MADKALQQREERLAFESLQRNLSGLVFIEPMNPPKPDIRATFQSSEIAVEVTRVDRDGSRMAKISFQQDLLDATQSILRGQIPPTKGICLNVALAWNPHRTKTSKREIKKSAEDLAKWIQHRVQSPMPTEFFLEELPDWDETVSESLRGLIAEIRIFTYPVTENPGTGFQDDSHVELCSSGGASCRPCAGEAEIKKAIQEKNSNIPDYRKELQGYNGPIWLLLTCNFDDFGMPPDYPDPHVDVACDHEFQRVFLIDHQSDIMIEIFHSKATHH